MFASSALKDRVCSLLIAMAGSEATDEDVRQLDEMLRGNSQLARYAAQVAEQQASLQMLGRDLPGRLSQCRQTTSYDRSQLGR